MGSAGHKFIAHTKALSPAAQVADGGYGPPPHPLICRAGQRYWPRRGRRRRGFVIRSVAGDHAVGVRIDGNRERVRITLGRLLARREDGQGAHYQFQGFTTRSYNTYAYVWKLRDDEALLCFPEWHPRRTVSLFRSLIPGEAEPGSWLSLRCDLGASSGARLQPNTIELTPFPGVGSVERPDLGGEAEH